MRNRTMPMAGSAMVFSLKCLKCLKRAAGMCACAAVVMMLATGCGARAYESVGVGETRKTAESDGAAESALSGENDEAANLSGSEETAGAEKTGNTKESQSEGSGKKTSKEASLTESSSSESAADGAESRLSGISSPDTAITSKSVCVYVCGAVSKPGVYELSADARIADAVSAAGGMTEEADGSAVNLSAYVADEMQITIPVKKEEDTAETDPVVIGASGAAPGPSSGTAASKTGVSGSGTGAAETDGASEQQAAKININTATASELVTLNGIGESRAADIIAYREEHGAFAAIEDIMKVSGIKTAVFEKIKDRITV